MSDTRHDGLPVAGYRPQTERAIDLVNEFKVDEERLLRKLDRLAQSLQGSGRGYGDIDGRWLAIGRTQLEQAFMAINRSLFRPSRARLAED